MEINYSSLDTIEEYPLLFNEFFDIEEDYLRQNDRRKLIDFSAGLGLSNSIHERFVKSIFMEYRLIYELSEGKYNRLVRKYKAPNMIKQLAVLFNFNLEEGFNLLKEEIQSKYSLIDTVENLLSIITEQRDVRNNFLHGDFNFNSQIFFEQFTEFILEFQDKHNYIFRIFKYSFNNNLAGLPLLSEIVI